MEGRCRYRPGRTYYNERGITDHLSAVTDGHRINPRGLTTRFKTQRDLIISGSSLCFTDINTHSNREKENLAANSIHKI